MYPNLWSWRQLKIDFLSVWEVKKWLINSGRSFNFKWRYKWHCASGLEGEEGIWYNNPFQKILTAFFILQHCVRKKGAGFHQKWQCLDCSLSNEEQGFVSVCSVWLAGTHWLINTGRERERPASIDQSCIGCGPYQCRIITHSHCPLSQLSWVKVKAKVINSATTLFLLRFEAARRGVKWAL